MATNLAGRGAEMKWIIVTWLVALVAGCGIPLGCTAQPVNPAQLIPAIQTRERVSIDQDWRFAFGHATDPARDFGYGTRPFFFAKAGYGDGPAAIKFDDRAWRKVDLPHDWAVELPFDPRGDGNHGSKAIGRNFPENSVGWYRKSIDIPSGDLGKRISLVFDGVYRDSTIWVNGHYIGSHPSGYSSFTYDVTDYLNYGGANVIAVRVDASREEGWFYEGAGIYRHVWLTRTSFLHVAQWGTFVQTTVANGDADIAAQVRVRNDSRDAQNFTIEQQVFGPDGPLIAEKTEAPTSVNADTETEITSHISVKNPVLWTLDDPALYSLITIVRKDGEIVDSYTTSFGIRTVTFDPDKGFFLNGQHVELKGVNNHQDFAGVGTAAPDGLILWRLKKLKEIGVNSLRLSHNPPAPELLDAADRLGLLIIDENRIMGTTPEVRGELEALIRRDRNHPSIILWSVGNEEWALEWTELGTRLMDEMQWTVHRLDPTRRTTAAASGSGKGLSLAEDVMGFNYNTQHNIDSFHAEHPEKPSLMTEEGSTTATRGIYFDDPDRVHLAAYDREARPGNSSSIEEAWQFVRKRPFLAGMFVWTGFDYRGETTPFDWPAISSQFGMLDTTGVLKDSGYYLKSIWTDRPMVHLLPHWNWVGKEGQPIEVWAYANTDEVELFLNGHSMGKKPMPSGQHLVWTVPYSPGTLSAIGYSAGKAIATTQVSTTGKASSIKLTTDRPNIAADGKDVAVITVNVCDNVGRPVPIAEDEIQFDVAGPARIIGVGNGDPGSHEADRSAVRYSYVSLTNWHAKPVDSIVDPPEVASDVDTTSWLDPFRWLPPERQPASTKALVLRGEFPAPVVGEDDTLAMYVARLDDEELVFLNGKAVHPSLVEGAWVLNIDRASLKERNNLALVVPTPEGGISRLADASQQGINWATLRIAKSGGPWQRRVFGGYAQLIVQSTGTAGKAIIHAQAAHLKDAEITINLKSQ